MSLKKVVLTFPIVPFLWTIVIPDIILFLNINWKVDLLEGPLFWLAITIFLISFLFLLWTGKYFLKYGSRTPAPLIPPKSLFIDGPYRYSRNPMILSVLLIIISEALFFKSFAILLYSIVFFLLNFLYIVLVEEKELERRFDLQYKNYKQHVNRWL